MVAEDKKNPQSLFCGLKPLSKGNLCNKGGGDKIRVRKSGGLTPRLAYAAAHNFKITGAKVSCQHLFVAPQHCRPAWNIGIISLFY
jgi:hypothetical protein